jgi:peptidoglycan/xylan/chitin deacetylase (PgdA/CDA1 family)
VSFKTAVKHLLGLPAVWRAVERTRRQAVVALTYHRVCEDPRFSRIQPDVFAAQIRWLRDNCDVIGAAALKDRIANGAGRPSVLVTFDDGYRDYHDVAYPILREFAVPAINFLPTRFIDEGTPFWWDVLDDTVASSRKTEAAGPDGPPVTYPLRDLATRRAYAQLWKNALKTTPVPDRSPVFAAALAALDLGADAAKLDRQVMTWDEVRATLDLTTPGGHTHSHPIMSLLDDAHLDREVQTGRDRIRHETGITPTMFAYPSGAFNGRAKAAVARAGYTAAFTTLEGRNAGPVDWMALYRVPAPLTARDLPIAISGW